jgi:restriction system protein
MKLNPSSGLAASRCEEPYHFPPDLFELLVETIPRLCRSKRSVMLFFRGAGVADCTLGDIEADLCRDHRSHSKFAMVRTVLERLNAGGDRAIRARREVIKRVVEFEDFTRCWPQDELSARGLVAEVQRLVAVKDSFTRMRLEREHERQGRIRVQSEKDRERRAQIERVRAIRDELFALFAEGDAYKRALKLEAVLNRLFAAYGISIRGIIYLT